MKIGDKYMAIKDGIWFEKGESCFIDSISEYLIILKFNSFNKNRGYDKSGKLFGCGKRFLNSNFKKVEENNIMKIKCVSISLIGEKMGFKVGKEYNREDLGFAKNNSLDLINESLKNIAKFVEVGSEATYKVGDKLESDGTYLPKGDMIKITNINDKVIEFECVGYGRMSLDESKHFTKVKEWTDWQTFCCNDVFGTARNNGKITEARINDKIYRAQCMEQDTFDIQKGIEICVEKYLIDKCMKEIEDINKTMGYLNKKQIKLAKEITEKRDHLRKY